MEAPIRILHVFGKLAMGGAETRMVDLYRAIDRQKVQFDFVVHVDADLAGGGSPSSDALMAVRKPDYYDPVVLALGGRIFAVPRFKVTNKGSYQRAWARLFKEHQGEWKAVQGHMTSTAAIYLPLARKAGIPMTIAHVRSAGTDPGLKGFLTRWYRRPLKKDGTCDFSFACTRQAGINVYGENRVETGKVRVIPNAIDVDRFAFQNAARKKVRESYGLTSAIVIGHVGRFHFAKNHPYLLAVFADLVKRENKDHPFYLMLIGEGGKGMEEMKRLARELQIADRVLFLGRQEQPEGFYPAMDLFCFPSHYEGLPGTVLEAQASGLPCLISDTITREVCLTDLVTTGDIREEPRVWADRIEGILEKEPSLASPSLEGEDGICQARQKASAAARERLKEAGFDVYTQAKAMLSFYQQGGF